MSLLNFWSINILLCVVQWAGQLSQKLLFLQLMLYDHYTHINKPAFQIIGFHLKKYPLIYLSKIWKRVYSWLAV